MQLAVQKDDTEGMSPTIYAALVDSLFQYPGPLFAGAALAAVAGAMTALKTGLVLLWPCVALLILVGPYRAFDMQWYRACKSLLNAEEAARWERRYQAGAIIHAAALGLWCFVAVLGSDDAVAHMICVSVTAAYMSAGAGRAFGRPSIYHVQVAISAGLAGIALALHGSPYYIGLACVTIVFFLALRQMTSNLLKIFVAALTAREREAALAGQFDTALNNMPHGLCMFGAD